MKRTFWSYAAFWTVVIALTAGATWAIMRERATQPAAKAVTIDNPLRNPVIVEVFGARERIVNNSYLDNSGGGVVFTARNRWGYDRVLFVDQGFDGTLNEVRFREKSDGEEVTIFYPRGNIQPIGDSTVYSYELWTQRFLEVRKEAAGPTSMPSR